VLKSSRRSECAGHVTLSETTKAHASEDADCCREHTEHLMFLDPFAMIRSCPLARSRREDSMPLTSHVPIFASRVVHLLLEVSCREEIRDEFYACR
jgi:hypothetical protein